MFFRPQLITHDKEGQNHVLQSGAMGQTLYIVPRARCAFRRVPLKAPGRQGLAAARFKAVKESANGEEGIYLDKDKTGESVGIWNFAALSETARYMPETIAREPMEADGARLVNCLDGTEGQVWENGVLIASRWWPQMPAARDWQIFLQAVTSADKLTAFPLTEAVTVPFRKNLPIFSYQGGSGGGLSPSRLMMGVGILALCSTVFFSAQIIHHKMAIAQIQAKINTISDTASQVLAQRRQALGNLQAAKRLAAMGDEAHAIKAIAATAQVFGDKDIEMRSVQIREGDMTIRMVGVPDAAEPELVAALEKSPALQDVTVNFGQGNAVIVKAVLVGVAGNLEADQITARPGQ